MTLTLKGKTAIVTGSSRGIGKAIAERLAADGASVVFNYTRNSKSAEDAVNAIVSKDGRAIVVQADVSKRSEVQHLFDEAEKAFGKIDIVVANAGVYFNKPLAESTEEDYDNVFNTNSKGVFFTLQEAAKRLRDGGRIIAVSSGGTQTYFPNHSLYLGSKGAIEQFVRALSHEVGDRNITVNVLSPGFTETDMFPPAFQEFASNMSPFKRVGNTAEVADVAAFLVSEQARWVTGQNVQAGGGVV